eukprot:scaffold6811_cov55-Phaeocystis_antarctica.AAC.2
MGTPGGGVAHRGRLLEGDADAAARGVFDGLSQGGEMGAGARATHPSDRRTWPRSTRRTIEGSIAWMRMRKAVQEAGRKTRRGTKVEMCSLIDARETRARKGGSVRKCPAQWLPRLRFCCLRDCERGAGWETVREYACQWALTRRRTLRGGGALEVGDLRLLEDGGERRGALGSDAVVCETASEGQDGNGERVGVSMAH